MRDRNELKTKWFVGCRCSLRLFYIYFFRSFFMLRCFAARTKQIEFMLRNISIVIYHRKEYLASGRRRATSAGIEYCMNTRCMYGWMITGRWRALVEEFAQQQKQISILFQVRDASLPTKSYVCAVHRTSDASYFVFIFRLLNVIYFESHFHLLWTAGEGCVLNEMHDWIWQSED